MIRKGIVKERWWFQTKSKFVVQKLTNTSAFFFSDEHIRLNIYQCGNYSEYVVLFVPKLTSTKHGFLKIVELVVLRTCMFQIRAKKHSFQGFSRRDSRVVDSRNRTHLETNETTNNPPTSLVVVPMSSAVLYKSSPEFPERKRGPFMGLFDTGKEPFNKL